MCKIKIDIDCKIQNFRAISLRIAKLVVGSSQRDLTTPMQYRAVQSDIVQTNRVVEG